MYSMIEDSTNILKSKRFKKLTKSICGLVGILLLSWYFKIHYHFLPLSTQIFIFSDYHEILDAIDIWIIANTFSLNSVGNFGNWLLLLYRT